MNLSTSSAQIAKATLHRLAQSRLEPTPENYARAWMEAGGGAADIQLPEAARHALEKLAFRAVPDNEGTQAEVVRLMLRGRWSDAQQKLDAAEPSGEAWAALIDSIVRGLERGGRQWTPARKKESLRRVLDGSRSDARRLRERLGHLASSWERDEAVETALPAGAAPADTMSARLEPTAAAPLAPAAAAPSPGGVGSVGEQAASDLVATVRKALPVDDATGRHLENAYAEGARRLEHDGADATLVRELGALNAEARTLFARRHQLVSELGRLARELTDGLTELAEDESWAQGQAQALRDHLGDEGSTPSVRDLRAAGAMLAQTRRHQQALKGERDRARDALRTLVTSLLAELVSVGGHAERFGDELAQYTEAIEASPAPDALAGLVREMLGKARAAQAEVIDASARLSSGQAQVGVLNARVQELEGELRRLSDEASTDALTQVANRRGLQAAFALEKARCEREGSSLAIGLIDVDNFKRLNDSLGHAAGDIALKTLAGQVRDALRPVDHVARLGGEEFVVLLPGTATDEACTVLTRLQRTLTASLFMHQGREVFVTFSAGVTGLRPGETLEQVLERADAGMFQAKHSGKNRTCAV
ncbi:MAG TPA: GGDEF domain-containing protein [Burkholderiaceae bacterium]|nr:GGDEF domain-containing protein [Burkholderiaceae bacterium]